MIRRLGVWIDDWLFQPSSGGRLWFVQRGFALLFAVRLASGNYRDLAGQPPALFRPPFFWRWLEAMPSAEVIVAVQAIGVLAALAAIVTRHSRVPLIVAWAALVFVDGLLASRGKIQHNDVLAILAAVPILMGPAKVERSDREARLAFGWSLRAALAVVALAYFFSGAAKLISSGPAWVFSDNLQNILFAATLTDRPPTDAVAAFVAEWALLAQLIAGLTLVVEIGFLSVLWRPKLGPWFAIGATGLHAGIWLTLGLDYWSWAFTVLLVTIDWPAVVDRLGRVPAQSMAR